MLCLRSSSLSRKEKVILIKRKQKKCQGEKAEAGRRFQEGEQEAEATPQLTSHMSL